MIRLEHKFKTRSIRMILEKSNLYFEADDISQSLGFDNPKREIAQTVINEKKHSMIMRKYDINKSIDHKQLFFDKRYTTALALRADPKIAHDFMFWIYDVFDKVKNSYFLEREQRLKQVAYFESANAPDSSANAVAVTQIAKRYGISGTELNKILHVHGVQYKVNGQWVLYSDYQDLGYVKNKNITESKEGKVMHVYHTYWTNKGVNFVDNLMKSIGFSVISGS